MNLQWMAWTPVTAWFFITIGLMLTGMAIWEVVSPNVERRGLLPISTSRGDRFFIGLLGSGFISLAWMGFTQWSLWGVLPVCFIWIASIMRYG